MADAAAQSAPGRRREPFAPPFPAVWRMTMNCLCNLFDDNTIWVIVIALLILYLFCNNGLCRSCG